MKIYKKISLIAAAIAVITASSCKKLLEENPKAGLYPAYLGTQAGIFAAITGVYSDMRQYFTSEGNVIGFYSGTDEQNFGASATTQVWATYNGLNSNTLGGFFNTPYTDINTLNGAIQFAGTTALDPTVRAQYLAQAKFLRAWWYFYLVQTFGGVTATNPSGPALHTTFNTQAISADQPATLAALYGQIVQDLNDAIAGLPTAVTSSDPFSGGGQGKSATVGVAQLYLAKVYLTRAYSAAAVSGDFQKAADMTAALIASPGPFGLWQDYSQAMAQANDYGKENMFGFDMGNDPTYSNYGVNSSGGRGVNQLPVFFRFNYISNAGVNSNAAVPQVVGGASPMFRDYYGGRPYIRSRPNTAYTINVAFADQLHDSRFDNTFQTFWICNQNTSAGKTTTGATKGTLVPTTPTSTTSWIPPTNGDTGILMPQGPPANTTVARRDAFKGMMTTTDQYSANVFPTVKKFDDAIGRVAMNDFSTRPAIQLRFSEAYMVNAEANYMLGNTALAIASLNVIRQRAAYRTPADATYIPASQASVTAANQAAVNAANANAMTIGTGVGQNATLYAQMFVANNTAVGSALCGMDVILDEYTREYYGDLRRWYDLVRTGQLLRRVKLYNAEASANIQPNMILRPIPQDEINNVLTGPKYPQNTGY